MLFSGKVSVITGASQGIGKTIAFELSKEGAEVVLIDIQREKLEEVTRNIKASSGKATAYCVNVCNLNEVAETVASIIYKYKKIDHLVNNAGITRDNLLMRMKEEDWDSVMEVNLKGVFNFSKSVIRNMASNRYGRIVNISSVVGQMGNAGQTNYSASKAGVIGFTKSLAREIAARGITVNVVAPGYIATSMTENLSEQAKKMFMDIIPLRRFGTPEEVSHVVKFLLSDESAYITGQVIGINGGMLM